MPTLITGLDGPRAVTPSAVVSPLVEFGSALHVLRDPGHHDAEEWAERTLAALGPRLARDTRSWWWSAQAIRVIPFVTAGLAGDGFSEQVAELRAMPAPRLARQLLRPISPSGDVRAALRWAGSRGEPVARLIEALVARPDEAAREFLSFLDRSWSEWFAAEWARARPALAGHARRFADLTAATGAAAALTALDPSITPSPGGGVVIAKIQNARHDVSRRGLQVAPSTFIRPHLYVADVPGRPLLLICPTEPGPPIPSAGLILRRLDLLAHRGRLEVARAIATEPRTAGEIATLWRMDPTQVNRHLRALASAGLARTVRSGRYVRYQLDAEAISALGADLLGLLLR